MRETLDPHYAEILEGLGGELSGQLFEECVHDLLREAYPSLVPIYGGQDAGMDAAIADSADSAGEAYPVVITTAQDVIGNLTGSLKSYKAAGGPRRKVVLAYSTALTPVRRRNLRDRATELGFTLLQDHGPRDLANRLYRRSDLTRILLGLTGMPRTLTALPLSWRPSRDLPLQGRDADIKWLHATSGDRIIVGQPGSGKTFLASQLVQGGEALFLTGDDPTAIANDLRGLNPPVVIVDDAHLDTTRLTSLKHLRQQIDADFAILATSWPGVEAEVSGALGGATEVSVRRLELLTRPEILDVLRSMGVNLRDDSRELRLLVDQSANKPGLAVTLGSLWLRGEWREVATGQAVKATLIPSLKRVLEQTDDPTTLLACFALGGDRGVSMQVVSEFLGMGLMDVRRLATQASNSGLLSARGSDIGVLVVHPEALRSPLLDEVFFRPPGLDYRRMVRRTEDLGSAVVTLIGAALREAQVPRQELKDLVVEADSLEAWKLFALRGREEAVWVLENYPRAFSEVASEVLEQIPRRALQKLLSEKDGSDELLRRWVQELPFGGDVGQPIRRRQILVDEALRFLDAGGDAEIGSLALIMALSPRLEESGMTASRTSVAFRSGSLPANDIPRIEELWGRIWPRLRPLSYQSWLKLAGHLHYWRYPNSMLGPNLSPETVASMRRVAQTMIDDLAQEAIQHPGLAVLLRDMAGEGIAVKVAPDSDFQVIFPSPDAEPEEREGQRQAARDLGALWACESPTTVNEKIQRLSSEARHWSLPWPGRLMEACNALAEYLQDPGAWLVTFLDAGGEPMAVDRLMRRAVKDRVEGWDRYLERGLRHDRYMHSAVQVTLSMVDLPVSLRDLAIQKLDPRSAESLAIRGEVSPETMEFLLEHEDSSVVLAAVTGEWNTEPQGRIRPEVLDSWRGAVLQIDGREADGTALYSSARHWLRNILASDRELAEDWLLAQLKSPAAKGQNSRPELYAAAISGLKEEQRHNILDQLPADTLGSNLASMLIGDSIELYRRFLERAGTSDSYLGPLQAREPTESWIQMVLLALEQGADPMRIAEHAIEPAPGEPVTPSDPAYLRRWESGLQRISAQGTDELAEVVRLGLERVRVLREQADAAKRGVELHGFR